MLLDVEVRSEAEADEAIDAGADIIMLDNIEGTELVDVTRRLKEKWTGKRKFLFETSGNITESNLQQRAISGEITQDLYPTTLLNDVGRSDRHSKHKHGTSISATYRL